MKRFQNVIARRKRPWGIVLQERRQNYKGTHRRHHGVLLRGRASSNDDGSERGRDGIWTKKVFLIPIGAILNLYT